MEGCLANLSLIRQKIIIEAESWCGTPYTHRQSCKYAGADCVGFPVGVCKAVGLVPPDLVIPYYSSQWHLHQKKELLVETALQLGCKEKPFEELLPGDFFLMKIGHVCSHTGIYLLDNYMIHAVCSFPSQVVRRPFDGVWKKTAKRFFTFPNVE
jgi:cell wall-associated NlpC family hydrolase